MEPGDPVTHGEFDALLSEKLKPLADKVGAVLDKLNPLAGDPGPDLEEEEPEDVTYTLRQMEEYAKNEVKKATKVLAAKKSKVEPKVEPEEEEPEPEVLTEEQKNKLKPEPTPIKEPGKKSRAEKMWGAA